MNALAPGFSPFLSQRGFCYCCRHGLRFLYHLLLLFLFLTCRNSFAEAPRVRLFDDSLGLPRRGSSSKRPSTPSPHFRLQLFDAACESSTPRCDRIIDDDLEKKDEEEEEREEVEERNAIAAKVGEAAGAEGDEEEGAVSMTRLRTMTTLMRILHLSFYWNRQTSRRYWRNKAWM